MSKRLNVLVLVCVGVRLLRALNARARFPNVRVALDHHLHLMNPRKDAVTEIQHKLSHLLGHVDEDVQLVVYEALSELLFRGYAFLCVTGKLGDSQNRFGEVASRVTLRDAVACWPPAPMFLALPIFPRPSVDGGRGVVAAP